MDRPIIIATTTFYKEKNLRFRLACETIRQAREMNYEIVVVDGSPDPLIAKEFSDLGAKVYPETLSGMGPSRRLAFFYACHLSMMLSGRVVVWMEPEKVDFVRSIYQVALPLMESTGKLVSIAKRSEGSWETYPSFQVETEKEANRAYEEITGRNGYDNMFGPLVFVSNPPALEWLFFNPAWLGIEDTYIQHYVPLILPSYYSTYVEVDFVYPEEQRREEERAENESIRQKRLWQKASLIEAYRRLMEKKITEQFL